MSSAIALMKRSSILGLSHVAGQAILFLSPIILVRMLSIAEFGLYRQFILYGTIAITVLGFCANRSLPYFIPKYPEQERLYTSQAVLFVLCSSLLGVGILELARGQLEALANFQLVHLLQLYIFFTVNLDFLEMYWLAKGKAGRVLFYSTVRLGARLAAVIAAGFLTGRAEYVVMALIVVEAVRAAIVLAYSLRQRLFSIRISKNSVLHQLGHFVPLGFGALFAILNETLSQLFISVEAGAEALALFFIGAFGMPIVHIIRTSIADVIFPEMAARLDISAGDGLRLWKAANVAYASVIFPVAIVFIVLAEPLVTILFTAQYVAAVPVFMVFACVMVVYCFEFHLPIRALNMNRYYLYACILALCVNLLLIVPLYRALGIAGPAVAFFFAQLALTMFLARSVMRQYNLSLFHLAHWNVFARLGCASLIAGAVLLVVREYLTSPWSTVLIGGGVYAASYGVTTRLLGLWSISGISTFLASRRGREQSTT